MLLNCEGVATRPHTYIATVGKCHMQTGGK